MTGEGPSSSCVDADRQIAHHILIDAHRALEFGDRRRRRVDIEQHVMALAVLVHAVGEVAQAPVFALLDLAALLGDQLGKAVGERVDLGAGNVLARDEHIFVKRHRLIPYGCRDPERGRRRVEPANAGKGSAHYSGSGASIALPASREGNAQPRPSNAVTPGLWPGTPSLSCIARRGGIRRGPGRPFPRTAASARRSRTSRG